MAERKTGSDRRMGPPGSDNWHAMLDGAEDILREEGHAALTSRRIAERIGVKQRLVYYYFRTMDDLIVDMFRRSSERDLQRLRDVCQTPQSLRQLWAISYNSQDARLISEYMALANRIPGLRDEVIRFIEESRAIQVQAITDAVARKQGKAKSGMTPIASQALAIMAVSLGLTLNREDQLGVTAGHAEALAVLDAFLNDLEG